jgi:electron transfer flavoprotein beta subunit
MHIAVCVKQIQDPEMPTALLRVDASANTMMLASSVSPVISPFDEQAVEAALRIRDTLGEVKITVLTMGAQAARQVLKVALSLGADEGVLLSDAACQDSDSYTTALVLSAAIKKLGDVDLVLTGRQAADLDAGIVGCGIAELLEIPAITFARDICVEGDLVRVQRVIENGYEVLEVSFPALVTVSHEIGAPRKASLRETMRAARKPIAVWSVADLALEAAQTGALGARRVRERLYIPSRDIECEIQPGATAHEMAQNLARRLHKANIL